jgi:hypothetical protein
LHKLQEPIDGKLSMEISLSDFLQPDLKVVIVRLRIKILVSVKKKVFVKLAFVLKLSESEVPQS